MPEKILRAFLAALRYAEPYRIFWRKSGVQIALHEQNKTSPKGLVLFWLGIKNDYRILIGADELDLVEKAEDEDDEDGDA